jgi:hypothetical protein
MQALEFQCSRAVAQQMEIMSADRDNHVAALVPGCVQQGKPVSHPRRFSGLVAPRSLVHEQTT